MSRASRRREERGGAEAGGAPRRNRAPFYIMGGSVLAALLILAIVAQQGSGPTSHHPMPRVDAQASQVMPAARYDTSPRVAETYRKAAEIVSILDGLYCYCFCRETFRHYSLLDCFKDDHAASCDVCLREAEIAYDMNQQGRSLDEIRQTIDGMYGRT
ncbi:MAG: hypothetical protein FJ207_07955 [Gemmatimonadetes bacterium]|nr:hypothetical protein [Gemmatimonadota bacterium]